jgi:alpha-amylase
MKKYLFPILLFPLFATAQAPGTYKAGTANNEVIYHMFLRSFYDASGDGHGDLKGLQQKLPYLKELGITSILLTPLYSSPYYHNYFADDFEAIDTEFGTKQDYMNLVKDIHRKGMKLYMDMETQYITEDHMWWKDSYNNPASAYSEYILYNDKNNTQPESIIFNLTTLPGYDGTNRRVTTVNLNSKKVFDYNSRLFKYWVDPNADGKFDDGVDGFRLDHAMDDLDFKGKLTDLFKNFWKPLITQLKKVNPRLTIIAEQADWADFGNDFFQRADVDRVFAFRLQAAFLSFDKDRIKLMFDSTFSETPSGKEQIVFIENHDMHRYATMVKQHPGKLKAGAALNLLTGGIPLIYYGQELGMTGDKTFMRFGFTDANDIPVREAFEWYKTIHGKGMALWYKNTGPWWDSTSLKSNDGISLEEQKKDPPSLYNFYKTLMNLRKSHPALYAGDCKMLLNNSKDVLTFLRTVKNERLLVAINLSERKQETKIDAIGQKELTFRTASLLYADKGIGSYIHSFELKPYELRIWELK